MTTFADISSHQGQDVDITAYAAGGHDRILVKATEGVGYVNPWFGPWWAAAGYAGLARGAYHYARPSQTTVTADELRMGITPGAREAGHFAAAIEAAGGCGPHDWVCLDTEDPDCRAGLAADHAAAFCERMCELGYPQGVVYSYGPYLREVGLTAGMLPAGWRRLHIAHYGPPADAVVPLPPGWYRDQVVARQFTDAAVTAGIPGVSDVSRVVREWLRQGGEGVGGDDIRLITAAVGRLLDERDARIHGEAFWVNESAGEAPIRQGNVPRILAAVYRKVGRLELLLEQVVRGLKAAAPQAGAAMAIPPPPLDDEEILDAVGSHTDGGMLADVVSAGTRRLGELLAAARGEH